MSLPTCLSLEMELTVLGPHQDISLCTGHLIEHSDRHVPLGQPFLFIAVECLPTVCNWISRKQQWTSQLQKTEIITEKSRLLLWDLTYCLNLLIVIKQTAANSFLHMSLPYGESKPWEPLLFQYKPFFVSLSVTHAVYLTGHDHETTNQPNFGLSQCQSSSNTSQLWHSKWWEFPGWKQPLDTANLYAVAAKKGYAGLRTIVQNRTSPIGGFCW